MIREMSIDGMLTVTEAAKYLGIEVTTLYNWFSNNDDRVRHLKRIRFLKRYYFEKKDLEQIRRALFERVG